MSPKKSIFNSVLNAVRKGRRGRDDISSKQVIIGNPPQTSPGSSLETKQQEFLDIQYQKIAHDLYSRSVYYDTDRLGAYNDYRAMDMSAEISAALDIMTDECLEANTVIPLLNGEKKTIEELFQEKKKNFWVYSYNTEKQQIEPSICKKVVYKGEQDVYKILFKNNSYLLATSEHLWLIKNKKEYIKTSQLQKGDFLQVGDFSSNAFNIIQDYVNWKNDYISWKNECDNSIQSVEYVGKRKTYDLVDVGKSHNFAVYRFNDENREIRVFSHNCVTRGDKGEILSIYSENERVKKMLKDLFLNVLNIEYNLGMWIRETIKFGDNFLLLEIDSKEGIFDVRELPVAEIHREEAYDGNMNSARFRWDINNMYFEEWQLAHFRLVSDGTKLPYGRSVLDPCRKLWKQLQLSEDAMLVYRVLRAPERRVHYIEVGNIDTNDIPAYIERVKRDLKKQPIVDAKTGQVNLKYNPAPVWKKTPIPLLDGRTISIEQLAKEHDEGKENYVYSVQDETHKIVPGKVVWCGKNYTAKKLTKVWLDDGTWTLTAPEHPYVLRDGTKARADKLKEGDSLMPYYESEELIFDVNSYKTVYNPEIGKYEFVHRLIASENSGKCKTKNTVHHIDFNKYNNNPKNLMWMNFFEHREFHSQNSKRLWQNEDYRKMKSETTTIANIKRNSTKAMEWYNGSELHKKHNKIRKKSLKNRWNNEKERETLSNSMKIKTNEKCFEVLINEIKKYDEFISTDNFIGSLINSELHEELKKINPNTNRDLSKFFIRKNLRRILRENSVDNYKEFLKLYNPDLLKKKKENYSNLRIEWNKNNIKRNEKGQFEYKNHKVVKVEDIIVKGEDVFCMTVMGLHDEHDRHNFAMYSFNGDFDNPIVANSGIYVKNTSEEDYFIPIRGDKGSRIETLPGASNLADIADVEYLQNKLFAALKVPKTYLNYSAALPGGSTLSQADLRFSRTINRIQESILMELRRIANIHLHFLGFDDDIDNFNLTLTNPSTQQELLKLETMKVRLEVFKEMFTSDAHSPVSYTWAMENIMGFSKNDIKQILRQKKIEKKMFSEIEGATEEFLETGLFSEINLKFRKPDYVPNEDAEEVDASETGDEGASFGGFGGGFDAGESFAGGDEFAGGEEALGGGEEIGGGEESPEELAEITKINAFKLLFEEESENSYVKKDEISEEDEKKNPLLKGNNKLKAKTKRLIENLDKKIKNLDKEDKNLSPKAREILNNLNKKNNNKK